MALGRRPRVPVTSAEAGCPDLTAWRRRDAQTATGFRATHSSDDRASVPSFLAGLGPGRSLSGEIVVRLAPGRAGSNFGHRSARLSETRLLSRHPCWNRGGLTAAKLAEAVWPALSKAWRLHD